METPLLYDTPFEPSRADVSSSELSGSLLHALAASDAVGVAVCDRAFRYLLWNRFMEALTGLPAAAVLGRNALEIYPHLRREGLEGVLRRVLAGESVSLPDRLYTVPGVRSGWIWVRYHPHCAADGTIAGVIGLVHEVTERVRAEETLRHQALHDPLTGLPNRRCFEERLAAAVGRAREHGGAPPAVCLLDLDRFKVVNDSLGHTVGDRLLLAVAGRLCAAAPPGALVARPGGDEFAVLLEAADEAEARRRTAALLAALAAPVRLEGYEVPAGACAGLAVGGPALREPGALLRAADTALHRAKAAGPGRMACFDEAMHAAAMARLRVETGLRRALARGEVTAFYQPVVSLESGRIAAAEALARWRDPARGWVLPSEFVGPAEETGLICALGRRVLEEACRATSRWPGEPAVSVNLSVRQLAQADLAEQVRRALAASGLPAERLRLEVTESVLAADPEAAAAVLGDLRAEGVRVWLDDFGTGYSSLAILHRLPVDGVKVDRSFVAAMGTDGRAGQVVAAVLALARALGLDAVAEGVERPDQLAALRGLGCGAGQGYLFSPPVEEPRMRGLLTQAPRW